MLNEKSAERKGLMIISPIARIIIPVLFALFFHTFCLAQDRTASLVREVRLKNSSVYSSINSLAFSGRVKTYTYVNQETFGLSMVSGLEEYYFEGLWIKPDSLRIVVTGIREFLMPMIRAEETDSLSGDSEQEICLRKGFPMPNPMRFRYDESMLEPGSKERLKALGRKNTWPVFPFAVGAESLYDYRIISTISVDIKKIIEIQVTPKYSDVPGVAGVFQIDSDNKLIVGAEYTFNEAAKIKDADLAELQEDTPFFGKLFSMDESYSVRSRKALFLSEYWLPVYQEEEIVMNLLGLNKKSTREIEFFSYQINPEINRDFFSKNRTVAYKRDSLLERSVFEKAGRLDNLNDSDESEIKQKLESYFKSVALEKGLFDGESIAKGALKLKLGGMSEQRSVKYAKKITEFVSYNRIEGLRIGSDISLLNKLSNNSILGFDAGYGFSDKRFKGGMTYVKFLDRDKKLFAEGRLYSDLDFEEEKSVFTPLKNSVSSMMFKKDYRDYYNTEGWNLGVGYKISDGIAVKISAVSQDEITAGNNINFGLFSRRHNFRENPGILNGKFRGLKARTACYWRFGSLDVSAEYTDTDRLKSDFAYRRVRSKLNLFFNLNKKMKLSIVVRNGFSSGRLTPQKWFDFGGKSYFSFRNDLRGVGYKAFTGDKMASSAVELTMQRGSFFDITENTSGWEGFLRSFKLIPRVGFGWSEMSDRNRKTASNLNIPVLTADKLYFEYGISLSDKLNILRFDLIRNNMSKTTLLFGLNFFR